MKLNIQTKLFLLLSGLAVVVLTIVIYVINQTMTEKISEKIINDFRYTQTVFQKEQSLRYDRLIETATLIGENSVFKANLDLNDYASVYFSVDEFSMLTKIDLFIVTNKKGTMLAKLDSPDEYGEDLSGRPIIADALEGFFLEDSLYVPQLWLEDDGLYQVVCVPVYTREESILGTITLGTLITEIEAYELKGETSIDISFMWKDSLIASTLDSSGLSILSRLYDDNTELIKRVYGNQLTGQSLIMDDISGKYFAYIGQLGTGTEAYYVATVSEKMELSIVSDLQFNIFIAAIISIILIVILAFMIGKRFSRPILKLVDGMQKVAKGDLNISVKPSTNDEIGLLTKVFNDMLVGLRERLHLMKYVGRHTIDMIKETSGREVELGGERKNIAVLFSDLRNFTRFSEQKTPEEIINMLNHYLGIQAELVGLYGGSVDKFVGDEMLALFAGEDAVTKALQCAVQIQRVILKDQNDTDDNLVVGIGINYGSVVIGNMGARDRMDYTVIGSSVNLGSRLCNAAEGGQILVPQAIVKELDKFTFGPANNMTFKGINEPVEIVEVQGEK